MTDKCALCDVEITEENKDYYGELLPAQPPEPAIMGYICKECNMDDCIFCDRKCDDKICEDCRTMAY